MNFHTKTPRIHAGSAGEVPRLHTRAVSRLEVANANGGGVFPNLGLFRYESMAAGSALVLRPYIPRRSAQAPTTTLNTLNSTRGWFESHARARAGEESDGSAGPQGSEASERRGRDLCD
jgi:hypothetical protein